MNKEDFEVAKDKYNRLVEGRKELIKLRTEIINLENDESVKRYLDIVKFKDKTIPSLSDIARLSFIDVFLDDYIYLFMGTLKKGYYGRVEKANISDNQNDIYYLYKSLENKYESVKIYPCDKEEFEKNNIVIKLAENLEYQDYLDIQSYYLKELISLDYDNRFEALEKVKKYELKRDN